MLRQTIIFITILSSIFIAMIVHAAENKENVFITTQCYEAVKIGDSKTEILWEVRVFNNNDHAVTVVLEACFYCRTGRGNSIMDKDTSVITLAPKEAKTQSQTFCASGLLRDAVDSSMPVDLVVEIIEVDFELEEKEDISGNTLSFEIVERSFVSIFEN
ncbi:MAG: hypothetical protein JW885_04060 [Deltaproteobacteria bacterium]|nr:hypothetical protein [Candidatus Zymogenaceae bacterium]